MRNTIVNKPCLDIPASSGTSQTSFLFSLQFSTKQPAIPISGCESRYPKYPVFSLTRQMIWESSQNLTACSIGICGRITQNIAFRIPIRPGKMLSIAPCKQFSSILQTSNKQKSQEQMIFSSINRQ